jgi:photosystem II stability/assembly factor-like uncharacterized protein
MHARVPTLAMLLGPAAVSGCGFSSECSPDTTMVDLGIETDLHAVVNLDMWSDERHYAFLAVGAAGTAVAWGVISGSEEEESFVDVFDLGDLDLRAAWIDRWDGTDDVPWAWWVVGDGGLVMTSLDRGATWNSVALQSDANLYGISGVAGHPIVVGDDIIAMRTLEGTWTELTPPPGGWGQLRGVFAQYPSDTRAVAVGLGGVIWSTDDWGGAWTPEPSGVTTDLFAIDYDVAVGAEGTLLIRTDTGWMPSDTGVDVDLIDYEGGYALGADGAVYQVALGEPLTLVDTNLGARGLTNVWDGWATVGDGGSANSPIAVCR